MSVTRRVSGTSPLVAVIHRLTGGNVFLAAVLWVIAGAALGALIAWGQDGASSPAWDVVLWACLVPLVTTPVFVRSQRIARRARGEHREP